MRVTEIKDNKISCEMTDVEYVEVTAIAKSYNMSLEDLFNYYIKEGLIREGVL